MLESLPESPVFDVIFIWKLTRMLPWDMHILCWAQNLRQQSNPISLYVPNLGQWIKVQISIECVNDWWNNSKRFSLNLYACLHLSQSFVSLFNCEHCITPMYRCDYACMRMYICIYFFYQ